jgi:hypothetical protein
MDVAYSVIFYSDMFLNKTSVSLFIIMHSHFFMFAGIELPDLGARIVFPPNTSKSEENFSQVHLGSFNDWKSLDPNTQQQLLNIIEQDTFSR